MAPCRATETIRAVGLPEDEETCVIDVDVFGRTCVQTAAKLHISVDGFYKLRRRAYQAQAELSRSNQQAALMQQLNAMQMQAANCCCENRAAIAQVRYDMATQACDTRNTVQNATRDIIDANNQNSRAILDFLTQSKLSDLQTENQNLKLAASQAAQNNYLISQLRPCPSPAYITCNPWAGSGYGGCGCNQGCGC